MKNKCVSIDKCLLPEIIQLWEKSIRDIGCCCGHGNINMAYIGVRFEDIDKMKELGYQVYFNHHRQMMKIILYLKQNLFYGESKK